MPLPGERLIALVGQLTTEILGRAKVVVVGEQEAQAWEHVREKYEFLLSALYMIAKKPLLSDPERDADELRYLVEETMKMIGVVNGVTPFDDLRFRLAREEAWHIEAARVLALVLDSRIKDKSLEIAIRSLLGIRSA